MQQLAPPAVVIRNDNPKLPVEPTVVVPPEIKMASNMPNLGDPMSKIPWAASNGTGSGGGIGSGSGGGVGSGLARALVPAMAEELAAERSASAMAFLLLALWTRPIRSTPKKPARPSIRVWWSCGWWLALTASRATFE